MLEKLARDSAKKGILEPEQFIKLIRTTFDKNVLIGKTTGQERAVLYLLAGTTGLRKSELLSLAWSDINLSVDEPFVRVRACIAKNGKEALQPLTSMVVSLLASLRAYIRPEDTDRIFASLQQDD